VLGFVFSGDFVHPFDNIKVKLHIILKFYKYKYCFVCGRSIEIITFWGSEYQRGCALPVAQPGFFFFEGKKRGVVNFEKISIFCWCLVGIRK
jgi:hypothetical protein